MSSSGRGGTYMAALAFPFPYRGSQSTAAFKEPLAMRQCAIISGSMIIASTENCTKYLPSDEDCREAGKITFCIMPQKYCNLSLCLRF